MTQCEGYKLGGQCSAEPRFEVKTGGDTAHYACGWHLAWLLLGVAKSDRTSVRRLW